MFENRIHKERILLIGCALGIAGFIPFTVYRFIIGDTLVASIELGLALSMMLLFRYVWRTHRVDGPALLICLMYLSVIVLVVHLKGPALINWMFPAVMGCFCVLKARTAAMISLLSMLFLFPALYPNVSVYELLLTYTSLTLLALFSYTFTIISFQHQIELSKLATKDALTGSGNRRSLDEAVNQIYNKHQRNPIKASLIMLDIDHFKQINDKHGHGMGDEILIKISDLLRNIVRVSDQIYRYGGEEFVLIAEGADLKEATVLAETIRSRVEDSILMNNQKVTISLGVAEIKQSSSQNTWLQLADEALYKAKQNGRNRVCLAELGAT